jgi:antitoxin VapB
MQTAKLFWIGHSQAARLPQDFWFKRDEVRIRRHGKAVILQRVTDDWSWRESVQGYLDADFEQASEEPVPEQVRADLSN